MSSETQKDTKRHKIHNTIPPSRLILIFVFTIWTYCMIYTVDRIKEDQTLSFDKVNGKNSDLKFFRLHENEKEIELVTIGKIHANHPDHMKTVIVTLVPDTDEDIEKLCIALTSLSLFRGDVPEFPSPVLIFHEGNLSPELIRKLIPCTDRPVAFPDVDFRSLPRGFDASQTPKFSVPGRSKWGYHQAIRFWVTLLWKHPMLEPFDTVVRFDSDSCFMEPNEYLPNFKQQNIIYHSQYVAATEDRRFIEGLYYFTEEFLKKENMMPTNTVMWRLVQTKWEEEGSIPVFMTNFEVIRKKFMQHPSVVKWQEALTEEAPFGVFQHRWADSAIRFLTMAIFVQNENVMTSKHDGFIHRECTMDGVTKSIENASS